MKSNRIQLLALVMAVLLLDGCRRRKPETVAPVSPQEVSSPAASVTAPIVPSLAPTASRAEPIIAYQVDAGLQKVLVKFYSDNTRPAMSWEDLVGGHYIPAIPTGPDGKPLDWDATMQRIGKAAVRAR